MAACSLRCASQTSRPPTGSRELEEGPLLADFLAMEPGSAEEKRSESRHPKSSEIRRASLARKQEKQESTTSLETQAVTPRERAIVVAALQRAEALTPSLAERADAGRLPLPSQAQAKKKVPVLFAQAFNEYRRASEQRISEESPDQAQRSVEEVDRSRPAEQLRVQPWHRRELQKKLCKAVLFHFLQDLRRDQDLRDGQVPLWFWEAKQAQAYVEAGQILLLVKYLVKTQLHIQRGETRSKYMPGSAHAFDVSQKLLDERRALSQELNASVDRVLSEDVFIRNFLDGQLSWQKVQDILNEAPSRPPRAVRNDLRQQVT